MATVKGYVVVEMNDWQGGKYTAFTSHEKAVKHFESVVKAYFERYNLTKDDNDNNLSECVEMEWADLGAGEGVCVEPCDMFIDGSEKA